MRRPKLWKNSPPFLTIQLFSLSSIKTSEVFFQIFVAFSEKLDFNFKILRFKLWSLTYYQVRGFDLVSRAYSIIYECRLLGLILLLFCVLKWKKLLTTSLQKTYLWIFFDDNWLVKMFQFRTEMIQVMFI